ncbi:unnamed protein product [Mucor circinelloides]
MLRATKDTTQTAYNSETAPFDLSTVKTKSQEPEVGKSNRLFGIQEAPTFYPTNEEFKDPLAYIKSLEVPGSKYGIIKIVPPADYHPRFSLNTESFRFKTRIQKLNKIEGETRTVVNYLEQVKSYYKLRGKSTTNIPKLDKKDINLYRLKKEVALRGGVQRVTRLKLWAEIGRELGYVRKNWTRLSNTLKTTYQKVILPYETWYGKHKRDTGKKVQYYIVNGLNSGIIIEDEKCEVCNKDENEDSLLLCDNRAFHAYCLNPPHSSVPKKDWPSFEKVAAVGRDYGFEDGKEYSLKEFQTKCDNFKASYFEETHPEGISTVTEDECERDFWRLVSDPNETCQVEYGADLHRSAFSSVNPTSDPWSLNAISVASRSLFADIKPDITGMMVPRLNVGMCFSALGWHSEDHYTHSISYMHWGETKTWYSVPGYKASSFQDAMRKAAPGLFKQQPDLLSQRATMLSPERLKKEDIDVYAVDQRPGQFVVVYPQAYHSEFNHGFNLCEAVNFAPDKQLSLGWLKNYKSYRRQPYFSYDHKLLTDLQSRNTPEHGNWLRFKLREMRLSEMEERKDVRAKQLEERIVAKDDVREGLQCAFCNRHCYLSYIGCSCTPKIACLEHVAKLCACDVKSKVMHVQFTDRKLVELEESVIRVDGSCDSWIQLLEYWLKCKTNINILNLRGLIDRARTHNVPYQFVEYVKAFVNILDDSNTGAERLVEPRQDGPKQTQTQTRYERCQDLMETGKGFSFKGILLPHIESYAAMLKGVDDQITEELFVSNDIDRQKSIFDQGVLVRSDSAKFQKLTKFIESIKASGSISPTSPMEPLPILGSTIENIRTYAQPKRSSALKRTIDYKESSSSASSPPNFSCMGSSLSYKQSSSQERFTTNHRGKGKERENPVAANDIQPASQLITAAQSANSTLQLVDTTNPINHTLKRKLAIAVDPSPTPERPTKAIKLTLELPKPIAEHYHSTPSLSPSPSPASPTSPTSSATTSPYPAPLYTAVPITPRPSTTSSSKKRKHSQDDSGNDNSKPCKKLK